MKRILQRVLNNSSLVLGSIALFCTLNSCSDQQSYTEFHDFKNETWFVTDTIEFQLEKNVAQKPMNLLVRNTPDYPFQNIWVDVKIDSNELVRKEILLANKAGRWLGDKSGKFYLTKYPLNIKAPSDSSVLEVVHLMRVKNLNGVQSIGLEVE